MILLSVDGLEGDEDNSNIDFGGDYTEKEIEAMGAEVENMKKEFIRLKKEIGTYWEHMLKYEVRAENKEFDKERNKIGITSKQYE